MQMTMRNIAAGLILVCLVLASTRSSAAEPTLARLGFWVPPERIAEFEAAYQKQVVPILKRHGLKEWSGATRATVDSVFARVFAFKTPAKFIEAYRALTTDPEFEEILRHLGDTFGSSWPNGQIKMGFHIYRSPAEPGERVATGTGKGHWRTYDVTDGLAHNSIFSIVQGREGDLWFGTSGGISRYDGETFTTLTAKDGLPEKGVYTIFRDRDDMLWFDAEGSAGRYDGETLTHITLPDDLSQKHITAIFQDREGLLWFGFNGGGVGRYDGETFTHITTPDVLNRYRIVSIFQDGEGFFWFAANGGGVSRYDGKTWTTLTTKDGLASNRVRAAFCDRDGIPWFGTIGGVSRYEPSANPGQAAFTNFTTKDGLPSNNIRSIFQDRDGVFWFGTWRGGVSRYDPSIASIQASSDSIGRGSSGGGKVRSQAFTTFSEQDGLAFNSVSSIFQDREGVLWFGTAAGGVSRFDRETFTTFTTQDGLGDNLAYSIYQDREGNTWFATPRGASRYDGQTMTTFTQRDGLARSDVFEIFQDRDGDIWFGTFSGLTRYDGKTFTTFTTQDGLAGNNMGAIFQDRDGDLWFGSSSGLTRYDGKTFTPVTTQDGRVRPSGRKIIQDREGVLWFGSHRYDGQTWTTLTTEDGLAHNSVRSVIQDQDGLLWFATYGGGVSRYNGKRFTTFTTHDGLALNTLFSVYQDREGTFWFGTFGGGVSRYDGKTWTTLTTKDGLASNAVISIMQDREGALWFATGGGMVRYRRPEPVPPSVFIDAVIADHRYEGVSDIAVPSSVELTAFEFHASSFKTRPEAMVYRYRLKGYEEDWTNIHDRRVEYNNVPRGTYTFEVQAVDRDLVYSETPATVTLTVHLPYERIGWMSILGVAIVLIGWQTVRVIQRDRRLRESNAALSTANRELFAANVKVQQQTERKSAFLASMSHELRTPMNAIRGFTNLVIRRVGDSIPDRQRQNLVKVTQASDHLLAMINDLLDLSKIEAGHMDVHPEPFGVQDLVASCCATVSPLIEEKSDVELKYEVAEGVSEAHTDQGRLRQMLINLLSNAIKFTDRGEVRVHCKLQNANFKVQNGETGDRERPATFDLRPATDLLEISVSDTGKGIPADEIDTIFDEYRQVKGSDRARIGTGLGLSITRKFAELLGGTITVTSAEGQGSTFTVEIPTLYKE